MNALGSVGQVVTPVVAGAGRIAAAGTPAARSAWSCRGEDERLVTVVNEQSNCTNLPRPTDYLLMREELGIVRRDPVFEGTLASAARLAVSSGTGQS